MRLAPVLLLVVGVLVRASWAAAAEMTTDDGRIVPGQRIGLARLGMTEEEIEDLRGRQGCEISAQYDAARRATRLETPWGGACRVDGDIQVGVGAGPVLRTFGQPDNVTEDARYGEATAYWLTYRGWGIAFRVLVMPDNSTMIQAIAVFAGTAREAYRTPLLPPVPWQHEEASPTAGS